MGIDSYQALVLLGHQTDGLDPETVVALVFLAGAQDPLLPTVGVGMGADRPGAHDPIVVVPVSEHPFVGVLDMEDDHPLVFPDGHADVAAGGVGDLGDGFDCVVQGVSEKGVDVLGLHEGKLGPVDHPLQLDRPFGADQGFVGQKDVQGLIA